jgi:ubiquitin-activating enzyme E1
LYVAKNVILAGVKSVALYDPELVEFADLSSQVYIVMGKTGIWGVGEY